jgi:hypothetical protein
VLVRMTSLPSTFWLVDAPMLVTLSLLSPLAESSKSSVTVDVDRSS